jgi:hypothetical protein
MEKLEEKKTLSSEKEIISFSNKRVSNYRGSVLSFASIDIVSEKDFDAQSKNEDNNEFHQIANQFLYKTPLQSIITKFCNNKITDYIFHTKIYLEYDEENAFIFIFKNSLVFTHIFDEKSNITENPIIYIVKFQQVNMS